MIDDYLWESVIRVDLRNALVFEDGQSPPDKWHLTPGSVIRTDFAETAVKAAKAAKT